MDTRFAMARDINGQNGFGLKFSTNMYSVDLTANTEATVTVPTQIKRWIAIFSYEPGADVWVANNNTAAGPAGATLASTTSSLNPVAREVVGGDVLSIISPVDATSVGVELYAIDSQGANPIS